MRGNKFEKSYIHITVSSDFTVFSPKNLVEILLNDRNHSSFAASSSLAGPCIFELVIILFVMD